MTVALYDFRLHLQGTRTIIDDLDSGFSVIPILTSYEGPSDCFDSTARQEGTVGFYKGFGALLLQYAAHVAVVRLTKLFLTEISSLLRQKPPPVASVQLQQGTRTRPMAL